jgi:GNAT superfamily N-acetyltransferase
MYPGYDIETIRLPEDATGTHMALYADDVLTSVVSLFIHAGELQFRKFATVEAFQGKGYGSILLRHVIAWGKVRKATRIWCNARNNAAAFYERFGFVKTDHCFCEKGIEFVVMELIMPEENVDC